MTDGWLVSVQVLCCALLLHPHGPISKAWGLCHALRAMPAVPVRCAVQISDHMDLSREDTDEEKVAAIGAVLAIGEKGEEVEHKAALWWHVACRDLGMSWGDRVPTGALLGICGCQFDCLP